MNVQVPLWQAWIVVVAFFAFIWTTEWFSRQYKIHRRGRFWFRIIRRWYGEHAHVCFRVDEELDDPMWYQVLDWTDDYTEIPWVLIYRPDDDQLPAIWCPLSDLAPYTVRVLRPWIFRYGRMRIPMLFSYRPLRNPVGHIGVRS